MCQLSSSFVFLPFSSFGSFDQCSHHSISGKVFSFSRPLHLTDPSTHFPTVTCHDNILILERRINNLSDFEAVYRNRRSFLHFIRYSLLCMQFSSNKRSSVVLCLLLVFPALDKRLLTKGCFCFWWPHTPSAFSLLKTYRMPANLLERRYRKDSHNTGNFNPTR